MIKNIINALKAVEADTTSSIINIVGAKKVSIVFHSTQADSAFSVQGSIDGTNFFTYNKLISNAANTNAQGLTRVASVTPGANTYTYVTLDPMDVLNSIKVLVDENTGATMNAWVYIEY